MRLILTILLFVAMSHLKGKTKSYCLPVDSTVNIIVGFNQVNPNSAVADVKGVLKNIPGVNKVLFCDNHSIFIINLNPSLISIKENFINQIKSSFPQDNFTIRDGQVSDIMEFCTLNDPTDVKQTK